MVCAYPTARPRTAKAAASWARHRTPSKPQATGAGRSGEIYGQPPAAGEGLVVWPSPKTSTFMVTSIPMFWAMAEDHPATHRLSQGDLDSAIACAVARGRGVVPIYVVGA